MQVKLRNLFARDTRRALSATPVRNFSSWAVLVAYVAFSAIWGHLLPAWGWAVATVVLVLAFWVVGSHLANKDALAADRS
jgi:uncharacterized membrane protein YjgN (DUF898 family)